jgi:hypothetical protein
MVRYPRQDMPGSRTRERVVLATIAYVLVALPFLVVRFPPITDLPQHVAQIRLLIETLGSPESPYTIQWFTPYALVYALVGAAWAVAGPLGAGRIVMLALGLLWVAAIHFLAARRGRSPAAATLACALFFSHIVYWGFCNFVFTWPIFALWLGLTTGERARRTGWTDLVLLLGCAALLYTSHVLWLAAAVLWLVLSGIVFRYPFRVLALRLASVVPVLIGVAVWFPRLAERGFRSPTVWQSTPLERLTPGWLLDGALGALTGPVEPLIFGGIVVWLVAGLWQARAGRGGIIGAIDWECLLAAGLFLALALFLPTKHTNTIEFAERWTPFAVVLTLLALPAPAIRHVGSRGVALGLLAFLTLSTAEVWRTVEQTSLKGLQAALDALPERPRVVGLDYTGSTPLLKTRPFLQTFAYAQVLRGGTLNFSFAEFAPSLVVYSQRPRWPWPAGLEWFPTRVRAGDFAYFDYALINADSELHGRLGEQFPLVPVTNGGTWRLYATRGAKSPG